MKDVLFLILARSGSKGVPNKNIAPVGGIPLLAYRILTTQNSQLSHDLVISTDSKEYADIAKKYGAKAPFLRPSELSVDTASSADACSHAIDWLEKNENGSWKYICLLEPTSPFTKVAWIEQAITKMNQHNASSIVACRHAIPHPVFVQDESDFLAEVSNSIINMKNMNRQNFKNQITPSGNFYISTMENFKKNKRFYNTDTMTFLVPEPFCLEIDSPMELEWAKFLIEKKIITNEMLGFKL